MLIPKHFQVHGRVNSEALERNRIFGTNKLFLQNSQNHLHRIENMFSSPKNVLERNSKSLLIFFSHVTELRTFFSSAEWFATEFWEFASICFGTELRAYDPEWEGWRQGCSRPWIIFVTWKDFSLIFSGDTPTLDAIFTAMNTDHGDQPCRFIIFFK